MIRTKILILLMCLGATALGCAKPAGPAAPRAESADKAKSLESKIVKLEDEVRRLTAARDEAINRARTFEAKWKVEESRAIAIEKERDTTRQQLVARTAEKESLQVQFDGFRKNLKELLGQAETAARPTTTGSPANVLPNPPGL